MEEHCNPDPECVDQDRRWVGTYDLPGTRAEVLEGYHARQALPGRCGRPALYRFGTSGELRPLPSSGKV